MESSEFYKRIDDLAKRADSRDILTRTSFLTLSEQDALRQYYKGGRLVLSGGQQDCERRIAFFLPSYMEPESFDPAEHIAAVRMQSHFGAPGHRDYMGAVLGLGIRRDAIGDIRVLGETAYLFCLPTVSQLLLDELDQVGRCSVSVSAVEPDEVPVPEVRVKARTFTVKSLRLDAVLGSMFGVSRTSAAELIRMGGARLNDLPCEKPDAPVKEGDLISCRGYGKGRLKTVGARSKKGRIFVETEVFV